MKWQRCYSKSINTTSIFITILRWISLVLPVLISVAFVTLLERKILGLTQYRYGPNKVSVYGILQPIRDAIKLFTKEVINIYLRKSLSIWRFRLTAFILILLSWSRIRWLSGKRLKFSGIFFILIIGFGIFPLFIMGWRSNSKFSYLGRLRGISQTISYEIILALILFIFFCFDVSAEIFQGKTLVHRLILIRPLYNLLISLIAETNRTPFDFSEGESELVSGFNTEYIRGLFAMIFLAEYGLIILFSWVSATILFDMSLTKRLFLFTMGLIFWIWLRGTFPRYRYDLLLNLAWKRLLPTRLLFVFLIPLLYFI